MSIDIGASDDAFETNNGTPNLAQPFLGPARLPEVQKEEYSEGEYPVIEFNFECLDDNEINGYELGGKRIHTHPEFPFTQDDLSAGPDDDMARAQKQADRIAWLLGYFMDEEIAEQAVQVSGADTVEEAWEGLRSQVVSAFESHGDTDKVVRLKVNAEVYNGDDRIQTPYYKGWLQDEHSDHSLSWGRGDKQDAKEWERAQSASPESNGQMEPAGEDDWDW